MIREYFTLSENERMKIRGPFQTSSGIAIGMYVYFHCRLNSCFLLGPNAPHVESARITPNFSGEDKVMDDWPFSLANCRFPEKGIVNALLHRPSSQSAGRKKVE